MRKRVFHAILCVEVEIGTTDEGVPCVRQTCSIPGRDDPRAREWVLTRGAMDGPLLEDLALATTKAVVEAVLLAMGVQERLLLET